MVDQRAVTEAMKALGRKSKTLREGMTAAIEAYEAARDRRLEAGMIDERFGRLTVVAKVESSGKKARWLCQCDCGGQTQTSTGNLKSGHTKSCGCLSAELTGARRRKHGHSSYQKTAEYRTWVNMKRRCSDPSYHGYHCYGGRGINVCEEWERSFEAFLSDMGEKPHGLTLDRIDVNGDYQPSNCRWATWQEQRMNQRPKEHQNDVA